MTLNENHPYIGLVVGGALFQTFLTAECHILEPLKQGLTTYIAVYFASNMVYFITLFRIEHFVIETSYY